MRHWFILFFMPLLLWMVVPTAAPPSLSAALTTTNPIPRTPPNATKISVGTADTLGEATITGTAGAALPLAHVLLVNLNSTHQSHTLANADGSFTARLFAPPGSAVMVKHGPDSYRWSDLEVGVSEMLNPYPGTILHIPFSSSGTAEQPFATAGAFDYWIDDPNATRNYVGSAWAMSGAIKQVVVDGRWTHQTSGLYDGQLIPGLYRGGLNWTHPALADLDGDGDVDMVIGEEWGKLTFYRNTGTAANPAWTWQTADFAAVNTGNWAYPVLADVTGDNAPDLFVGREDGYVAVYYNNGTPTTWPANPNALLPTGGNNAAAPTLTDLDGDGDKDLLIGHTGGTLTYYRNTGTAANPIWSHQTDSYATISEADGLQPTFINLDGDGDLDLLVGKCGSLVWYARSGTAANPTWTRQANDPIGYGGGSCATSPATADWNGDGSADLVIGEHWGTLRFFHQTGGGWAEQPVAFPFELGGDSAPAVGDWDDDGDLDLLIGNVWGQLYQYENGGTATAADWQPQGILLSLPWTNHPHAFPTLADINGDGDLDLFIGEGGFDGPDSGGNIHYYQNVGTAALPNWQFVTANWLGLDVGGWSAPVLADIDDDGDLDLFIGAADGTLTFVPNTGTAVAPAWGTPQHPYANLQLGEYSAPALLDVDSDGDLDLLVGLGHGSLAYVRNTGTAALPAWELVATQYPDISVGANARPVAADLNGDGDHDLLLGDGDGGLNLYLYEGADPPPPTGVYQPGDLFHIGGTLRLYSPAITAATNPAEVVGYAHLRLRMLGRDDGRFLPSTNYFMSIATTPTGLPIQQNWVAQLDTGVHLVVENWQYGGGHMLTADFALTGQIPATALPGFYRPSFWLSFEQLPHDQTWLAANVTQYTYNTHEAVLPPLQVGGVEPPRLIWRLLMDDYSQGQHGTGAREDAADFALASQIVTQGASYIIPRTDAYTAEPIPYRLEPFLPAISFTDRRMPAVPMLPFALPGGELCVSLTAPDGSGEDLGCAPFQQSSNRTSTTRAGADLNIGTVQMDDVYALTTNSDQFVVTFAQHGRYTIHMAGHTEDIWGNLYEGGGTYEVWVAETLDIDPGVLPGTPLAVGDAFNPAVQLYPRVAADVALTITHYPNSDPALVQIQTVSGRANAYGAFAPTLANPLVLDSAGEFRVDVTAVYTAADGTLYMGSMAWGSIVMTPDNESDLVAHGRRGVDSLVNIPSNWFVNCRDLLLQPGLVSHALNPYYNGDVLWTRFNDNCPPNITSGGDSLIMGASVQDTVGIVEAAVLGRAQRMNPALFRPGNLAERLLRGEIPLFSSTYSGLPPNMMPSDLDQIAYSYRSSQRPGVRVREVITEDGQSGGYWRLDTLYDNQLGVGLQGDLPNDFKFQYVGAVYRDLASGQNEYVGQGSGWFFLPESDVLGSRAMPPFAGQGNGGWTAEGGSLLTLHGEAIDIFLHPTGTLPGAVLEMGDTFRMAGHMMPTLDSHVQVTVTAPSGAVYLQTGQANKVGYFYQPTADLLVNEPGVWTVDTHVWHDGQCSGGSTVPPYPSGDVLGSEDGRYVFYVVPPDQSPLKITTPAPGFLSFDGEVPPIAITGLVPAGVSGAVVEVTAVMPGAILERQTLAVANGQFTYLYDPVSLSQEFLNLDLIERDDWQAGLADTIAINFFVRGQQNGQPVFYAAAVTLQGNQVFVAGGVERVTAVYLPLVVR